MKKYNHPLTKTLTPDNWQEKINLDALTVDDLIELLYDMRKMENFGKKLGGFLKEVIKVKCEGMPEFDGRRIFAEFSDSSRIGGLDEEAILEEMGEEWVENHRKPDSEFKVIKLKAKED